MKTTQKIGGPGKVVEIDEAKIGKRKYEKGRVIEGKWIFGGIERGSSRLFVVPVEKRNRDTLLNIIQEYIEPGTTIMSDQWKAYQTLNHQGFHHFTVNHSYNFVDPDSGIYKYLLSLDCN